MLKKAFLLAIVATLCFIAWHNFKATTPQTPVLPPTPEQEVSTLLSRSVIPAKELAELSEKYPSILTSAFKKERKLISVSGKVSKALTSGIESENIKIELDGSENLRIMFSSDRERLLRWIDVSSPTDEYKKIIIKFHRENKSLILLIIGIHKITGNKRMLKSSVVCREGERITLRGEFRHIAPGWVKFDLLEMP